MKMKPVIADRIYAVHTMVTIDFRLDFNVVVIMDDSGVGKTMVYNILKSELFADPRLAYLDYTNLEQDYKSIIRESNGKIFIIDNADVLLDDIELQKYIAFDHKNQYIILGHNIKYLWLVNEQIYCLEHEIGIDGFMTFKLSQVLQVQGEWADVGVARTITMKEPPESLSAEGRLAILCQKGEELLSKT